MPVSGGLAFTFISTGYDHSCGVTTSGSAYCWGLNNSGQLGNGSSDVSAHTVPEAVSGNLNFSSMSAGGRHTCGITTNGAAYCWGQNQDGQLGDGLLTDSHVPVRVANWE